MTKQEITMNDKSDNPFLTVAEAANYLRLKKRTLDNMRWMGTGPKFRKHGGRIYYDFDDGPFDDNRNGQAHSRRGG